MIPKGSMLFATIALIAVVTGMVSYVLLTRKTELPLSNILLTQMPSSTPSYAITSTLQPSTGMSRSSSPSIDTSAWKTYINENYGIVFKYQDSLYISENSSVSNGGELLEINLIPSNQHSDSSGAVKSTISITSTCLIPENVPKKVWETNFQQGLPFENPIQHLLQEFVKTYETGKRKLFVFKQGCYECYDGWNPETQTSIPNPNREYDGFSAYSCEAGLNKNGNKAARCLTIMTERQKIGSLELNELQKFFLDDFIPTLELQQGLINVHDCEGLGESIGTISLPPKKT